MEHKQTVHDALNRLPDHEKDAVKKEIDDASKRLRDLEMKEVTEASSPTHTPTDTPPQPEGLDKVDISPETRENIEAVSRVQGNKELHENAVDRAMSRQSIDKNSQEFPNQEQQKHNQDLER